ncbi:MAG: zinc-ribbon and DUF3426 domain-containing protein [Gammaproteobacteria bacterium]
MFTVCPKCALTLVVTAQDLRVAQGYVRCGRCSNVFNAIVGLTDDRGALGNAGSQSTATTSIIRKAPSISDDERSASADALSDTGESEAVYAEPDQNEVKFQEVFAEPTPPTRSPARTPPPTPAPTPETRTHAPISFVAPPPGPPVKAPPAQTQKTKVLDPEKRYSDTEGIESFSESELEFDPSLTDVTKVFVEAAPVAFKGDATGKFRKFVMGAEQPDPSGPPSAANAPRSAVTSAPAQPAGSAPAPSAPARPAGHAAGSSAAARAGGNPAAASGEATATASTTSPAPPPPATPARATATPPPPKRAELDADPEDIEIDSELRSLAARLDATSTRPAPKFSNPAANDEAIANRQADAAPGMGDVYAKAVPRPREQPKPPAAIAHAEQNADVGIDDSAADDARTQAVDSAIDTFTPAAPPRSRFMWWVAGAAVLSLALVGQTIHHDRHSLATNALLNRPLTKFYKAIGVPLVPSWNLRSYDVRQLGASTGEGADGTLTVRASLKNTSAQPLPLPLLRITMQDRYGNRIATRDVPPSGYVPGAVPPEAHLGVGQRIDAEMTFKDPGQNAVGFEIDACLATANGRIACANDQAPAPR